MSSFYGNIKNSNRISLIFDKVYTSRTEMEKECTGDGIFNNRFILIDYGQKTTVPFTRVFPTQEEYEKGVLIGKYYKVTFVPPNNTQYGQLGYDPTSFKPYTSDEEYNLSENRYFIARESLLDSKTLNVEPNVDTKRRPILCPFVTNKEMDLVNYGDEYQHTVWQKIWTQTGTANTVIEKYICVAKLDAEAPILNLIVDAPSDYDAEGFDYVKTDKNVNGYLTEARYGELQTNSDSWVYISAVENGKIVYKPAQTYDIGIKYHTFKQTPFKTSGVYEKVYDESGINLLYIQEYKAPTLYRMIEIPKDSVTEYLNKGYSIYTLLNIKGEDQYIIQQSLDSLSDQIKYYVREETTYENGGRWQISTVNSDAMVRFYEPLVYNIELALTGNDFKDGYITQQKYEDYTKELFYFNEAEDAISTLIPIERPADGSDYNGIYYKNTLGEIIKKTNSTFPVDYEYFRKQPYDKNTRYWEIISIGKGPHFDPLKSTDLEYMLHVQRPWKFARDVNFDYNPKGFVPYKKSFDATGINSVKLETETREDKLTTKYPVHMPELPDAAEYQEADINYGLETGKTIRSSLKMEYQPDTKYFDINLPEIGNTMSDIWDLIYPRGTMAQVEDVPTSEYDEEFNNLLLGEDGQAKYYYLAPYKEGYLSQEKYEELKDQLAIKIDGQYIKSTSYDHNQVYYLINAAEDGLSYDIVESDILIYKPIYSPEEIIEKKEQGVDFYSFTKDENGEIRVLFIGNDRDPNNSADYPETIGEVIRHAYYLLGLKEDNDTIDNPPRGTIYGLLNGAKTLYGDPNDKMTGTYKPIDILTQEEFNELKDLLWRYDAENNSWYPAESYEEGAEYFIVETPGYQLVPTDIPGNVDGYISENLFNYLKENGKWPLFIANGTNGFIKLPDDAEYNPNIQYYSNLTTLWAYLNDIASKYPLYQADWMNNNSNSIGYIQNRPAMVATIEEYPTDNTIHRIENLWNNIHSVPVVFTNLNQEYRNKNAETQTNYAIEVKKVKDRYGTNSDVYIEQDFPADADQIQLAYENDLIVAENELVDDIAVLKTTNEPELQYNETEWQPIIDNAYSAYELERNNINNENGLAELADSEYLLTPAEMAPFEAERTNLSPDLGAEEYNTQLADIKTRWLEALNNKATTWKTGLVNASKVFSSQVDQWKAFLQTKETNWIDALNGLKNNIVIPDIKNKYYPENAGEVSVENNLFTIYNKYIGLINELFKNATDDKLTETDLINQEVDLLDVYNVFVAKMDALKTDYQTELEENKTLYSNYIVEEEIDNSEWFVPTKQSLSGEPTASLNTLKSSYNKERTDRLNQGTDIQTNNFESKITASIGDVQTLEDNAQSTLTLNTEAILMNIANDLKLYCDEENSSGIILTRLEATKNYIEETCKPIEIPENT